ncbi:MAG: tyrosine recombinase XerD [Bacteroidaceae bacterium]|nr:tyrosine recombinase XerD [Bacteroidaceae bacterium]
MEQKEINGLLRRYYQYLKLEKSFSPNTIDAYQRDLQKFFHFIEEKQVHPLEVGLEDFHEFAAALHDVGIHPTSLYRILMGVRNFYKFLVMTCELDGDPTELLELPQKPQHLPDILSVEEIDVIENAIDLSQPEGQRNKAMIEVMFSCGLRVSELCNLKLSDLFLDEGFIRVTGKGSKQRLVPISPKAVKELNLYFADRCHIPVKEGYEDYVFLSQLRKKSLSRILVFHIVKELVEKAGIKKTVSPHTFRHSFATSLLEGGANLRAIQAMLGHESISTTEIYMHIDTTHLREEILTHHPRYSHHDNNQ